METHLTHGFQHQNPRHTPKRESPVGSPIPRGFAKHNRRGIWREISQHIHTRRDAHAHESSHTQKEEQQKQQQQQQQISHTAKMGEHGRDLDLDLHHTAGDSNSAVVVVVVSKPYRAAYHPRAARSLRTSLGTRPPPPPPRPSACSRNGQGSCGSNGRVGRCRARQAR